MGKQVMFSSGEQQKVLCFEKLASEVTLKEARETLIKDGFFINEKGEDKNTDYRYVFPEVEVPESEEEMSAYSDRVLGLESEKYITIDKLFLKSGDEIVLTNVNTEKLERPNLIGFRTSFWKKDDLQVTCRLRPGYNNSDVPEPYLLTDVITSRSKDFYSVHIPNVVVCVQNSIIEFPIACKCTVGMAYSAWMNGERIFDYATPLSPEHYHEIAYGCFDCFNNGEYSNEKSGPKAIKVEKLSASDIASKEFVSYDITITVDDVTQWTAWENNKPIKVYTENTKKKEIANNNFIQQIGVNSIGMAASLSNTTSEQFVLDNKSYFNGKIIPGKDVPKRMPGVNGFTVDKKGGTIASLQITVLVFKDMETAKKYVGRYNPIIC